MNFRKYAEYKESGVEWLGKVPAGWEVSLIKRRYQVTLGQMLKSNQTSPDETEEPYLRAANIHWRGVDTTDVKRMWFTAAEKKKLKLRKGDLLVCEGGDVGRGTLWNEEMEACYIQNSVNRIRARKDVDTRFLYYWLYFIKHVGYIDMICNKATIAHFTVEKVEATPCVYPPLEEQKQIAAFLDRETESIDALVDKQEHLIALLREKRQAVISNAVTKGLNPKRCTTAPAGHAKMKDSGVAWLGEVPAGWEVKPLKHLACINRSVLSESTDPDYEFDYVDIGSVSEGSGITKTERMKFSSAPSRARRLVQEGDAIISTVRTYLRAIAPIKGNAGNLVVSTGFCVVSPRDELKPAYCSYLLQAPFFVETVVAQSVGVSYPATNASDIANISISVPPLKEQKQIAAFLDRETEKIDALIEKCETAIGLLKERRTALISAAVTGKIDVRRAI